MARKQPYMTYGRKGKLIFGKRARISTFFADIGNSFESRRNARSAKKLGKKLRKGS